MLHDSDRIFTNLYGQDDWSLAAARRRGVWDNTKALIELGRDSIIQQIKDSGLRGRGGAGLPAGQTGRASCRDRVCQYVSISVVAVYINKTSTKAITANPTPKKHP